MTAVLLRSNASRVVFLAGGRALLDGTEVPLVLDGLVVDEERRLTLAVLPSWPELSPRTAPPTPHPGALAVWRGRAYFVSPEGATIRVRDCAGDVTGFATAAGGPGPSWVAPEVTALATTSDDTLLVADRGRGSVRELDLLTGQTVWAWTGLAGVDDVTVSPRGTIYASGARGILRLDRERPVVLARRTGRAARRTSLAWGRLRGREVLFVALGTAIVVLDLDTGTVTRGRVPAAVPPRPRAPLAVRWDEERLYVASPASVAIRVVDTTSSSRLGELPGTPRPFAAFGVDSGTVWISDGESAAESGGTGSVPVGTAGLGPVAIELDRVTTHALRLRMVGLPPGADARVAARFDGAPDAVPAGPDIVAPVPASASRVDVGLTLMAPAPRSRAGELSGLPTRVAGVVPAVAALDLTVDAAGWIEQLPAIYREERADPQQFLEPFLRLTRSALDDVVDALRALPEQIDPATSYDDLAGERWLDWLSGWVDVRLDETMAREVRRILVSGAFERHGTRGTARHLREILGLEAGLDDVVVAQPGDLASVWVLGGGAELGQQTMTAAAAPDGSILDTSAVADRSHLTGPADYGAPLFGDLAHRFDVLVHAAHVRCPEDKDRLVALIERERPAHTRAHLCVIEPGISVGIQALVGVDSVIGEARHGGVGGLDGFTSPLDRERPVLGGAGVGLALT